MLKFGKFARKTKSAVIPGLEKFFYSTLNQQSSQGLRNFIFFTLGQYPSQSIRGYKKFYLWSTYVKIYKKDFLFWKNIRDSFKEFFLVYGLDWELAQVVAVFTTSSLASQTKNVN